MDILSVFVAGIYFYGLGEILHLKNIWGAFTEVFASVGEYFGDPQSCMKKEDPGKNL